MQQGIVWLIVCSSALFLTASTASQSDCCPVFGTNQSSSLTISMEERVFLNFEAPSQCRGNVTSWTFCHYISGDGDNSEDNILYAAKFIVYRRSDTTSDMYEPVAGSITSKSLPFSEVRMGFTCLRENISRSFEILENDVIGACVRDQGSLVNPLYLVGDDDSDGDQKLYQYNRMNFQKCTEAQLASVNTKMNFRQRSQSKLHLYANIDVAAMCQAGNNPPATVPLTSTVSGTYLNTADAAMCSDHITSWHYCYYPSAAPVGQTYTMTVAAWRLDAGTYRLIQGTSRTITLNPIETKAKIFCKEEALNPVDYVLLSEGDVIGVVLPSTNPIPVVSTNPGSGSSLRKHPQNISTSDLLGSEFIEMSNSALHVYAELEFVFIPTTGLSSGGVAAVVICVLGLLIGIAVFIAVLLLVVWKQRRRKQKWNQGLDNATYHMTGDQTMIGPSNLEKDYESIVSDYLAPVSLQPQNSDDADLIDNIYQDINEGEGVYYAPMDAPQIYQEYLEEAKRGSLSSSKENPYQMPSSNEAAINAEFKKLKIRTIAGFSIEIGDIIGSGQFGTVNEATWKQSQIQSIQVAAKTLKDDASQIDGIRFLQEAAIMAQFRHPNVVGLYGVAQKSGKRMMIVELLSKGDLHNYMKALKPDPGELVQSSVPQLLLEFSQHIALGMGYLSGRGFVHRDLAARNILVSDHNICMIADFGMSRDLQDTDYYVSSGGKIPLKWTAPEAIHYKKYSTASDVWSYGCVLYEIWSLGTKPFEDMGNAEVLRTIHCGDRLPPPPGCPKRVYKLMIQTWTPEATNRPEFRDIILLLLENKSLVLEIPSEDMSSHPQASVLGAPLEAGHKMYITAQNTYRVEKHC